MPLSVGLFHCHGAEQKCNWLMVRHVPGAARCVVFFPGDISDFASGGGPSHWSLEALLWVLCCKFPEDTVVLVKPHMMVDHFAIYVNFMLVDGTGNPRPLQMRAGDAAEESEEEPVLQHPRAVRHLEALLASLERELAEALPRRLALVGFSKGAAVLGALLREGADEADFWSRPEAVHFVDAGLTIPGVFPVGDKELLELRGHVPEGFAVWLHGTPRQMQDPSRPFVAEEADAFAARCEAAGLRVERRGYAEGQAPSLDQHFDSLRCFQTGPGDADAGDRHLGFFGAWREAAQA